MFSLVHSDDGKRVERYSLAANPTFESAIRVPLSDVNLPRLKATEDFFSPAVQALRLLHGQM